MADYDLTVLEPAGGLLTADSTTWAADDNTLTADAVSLPSSTDVVYAAVNADVLFADIYEPVRSGVTADTTGYTADSTDWTADGGALDGAQDYFDAEVIAESLPGEAGGGLPYPQRRPFPVVGVGFGILPALEGEAHGVVTIVGAGVGILPRLGGSAEGSAGVAGRSAARLVLLRAAAIGDCGQLGRADAILKGLVMSGRGAAAVHGSGSGAILKFEAAAAGQHDDDEAAVMAFLLAA